MKSEHMVIIGLLLALIFLQVKSKYGLEDPTKTSVSGSSTGFYKKATPTL
jgi:hypothetical protein